ncbi:MAG TPA: DUF4254 domain-containing protein [Burkholderiales bacterium]|nr:DUF4254 domain-containing protein [Burkholderiales bacterium]
MTPLAASALLGFHDGSMQAGAASGLWRAIEDNHRCNGLLWDEEDLARRRHAPDAEIAGNKRAIDRYNQQRNDAIERVDEHLFEFFFGKTPPRETAKLNSETPGAMIDRLSILSLKVRSMRAQTERTDVDRAHVEDCLQKLNRLQEQRADLAACLDRLLAECARGESRFKIYRQFKMYNDPKLNPAVYGESKRSTQA